MAFIKKFSEIYLEDINEVGGKNASLGELFNQLASQKILVPDGFATTAEAYWYFLKENNLTEVLTNNLQQLDTEKFSNLSRIGSQCRDAILNAHLPDDLQKMIRMGLQQLTEKYGRISLAVRSSATAEDLPNASFAGQQETYLNVESEQNLLKACVRCYASLFTDRAIKYRHDNGFNHMKVALSIGVQIMVRSDKACSGVIFTLEPDSGFEDVVLVSGAWGLGENVVQGNVNADEFMVFKPFLGKVKQSVISRKLGSKTKTMIYAGKSTEEIKQPEDAVLNLDTTVALQEKYILSDREIICLAEWAVSIEKYYGRPMDIEWAKDGISGQLFIVQARPETIHSQKAKIRTFTVYKMEEKSKVLCQGIGLGNRITTGKVRILNSPLQIDELQTGEILVTTRTDPDWDPVLKKASAIITDQGGRTSHAAIVARELGVVAVVGSGNATQSLQNGQFVTVSAAEGDTGFVYEGKLRWKEIVTDISQLTLPHTKPMLILGHPDQAFKYAAMPNEGVGLMRMEFIINNAIRIHPMALRHFEKVVNTDEIDQIEKLTHHFPNKEDYFVEKLAEATAVIAAAFYPKDVIVRMSDFKTNEYAGLIGGKLFEPSEENPMIGFRGASRYYDPLYQEGFEMECKAMKKLREEMGFVNVKLMIPFCRTVEEARKVLRIMEDCGLKRGENNLEIYMMAEIPSNALLAEEFAKYFDGFSIGSNDLTQLTLGADRDSALLASIFTPFDEAVMQLIEMILSKAKAAGIKTGLCGQAPSDYPEFARFLVENGINSISFNPDALIKGIENIHIAEEKINQLVL